MSDVDVDPTPGTPVTLGDRLAWFRGDVQAQSADQLAALEALAGVPAASLADLVTAIAALRGLSNTNLGQLLSEDGYVNAQVQLQGRLLDIEERLDRLQAGIGAVPYESLELGSVRGYLASILGVLRQQTYGRLPSSTTDTNLSSGEVIYNGRRYAIFGDIAGVTESDGGRTLTADWSGWQAYIQTTDPAPQVAGAADVPNAWIDLVGTGPINFSVAAAYTISVYLRAPEGLGDVVTLQSGIFNEGGTNRQYAIWPQGSPFNASSYLGDYTLAFFNLAGWNVRVTGINSGTHIMKWGPGPDDRIDYYPPLGTWVEWTSTTSIVYFFKNGGLSDPFTVELVPPGFPIP